MVTLILTISDPATLAILIPAIFAGGTLGLAYFTLKSNSKRDFILLEQNAQVLAQAVQRDTITALQTQLTSQAAQIENQAKQITLLQEEIKECKDARFALAEQNYELMQRVLGVTKDKVIPMRPDVQTTPIQPTRRRRDS